MGCLGPRHQMLQRQQRLSHLQMANGRWPMVYPCCRCVVVNYYWHSSIVLFPICCQGCELSSRHCLIGFFFEIQMILETSLWMPLLLIRHCLLVIFPINIIEILMQVSTRASVVKITASSKLETTAILESDTEVDSQQLWFLFFDGTFLDLLKNHPFSAELCPLNLILVF